MTRPRRAGGQLSSAVATTLDALTLTPADTAAAELVRKYAAAIDRLPADDVPRLIGQIGPSLLRALEALGATPAARASIKQTMPDQQATVSPLERLRVARGQ